MDCNASRSLPMRDFGRGPETLENLSDKHFGQQEMEETWSVQYIMGPHNPGSKTGETHSAGVTPYTCEK